MFLGEEVFFKHRGGLLGGGEAGPEGDEIRVADGMNSCSGVAAAIEEGAGGVAPEVCLEGGADVIGFGLEGGGIGGVAEAEGECGEGGVFCVLEGVEIAGEEEAIGFGAGGVGGVVVRAGLHGVVPEVEAGGGVSVGFFAAADDLTDFVVVWFYPSVIAFESPCGFGGLSHEGF